MTLRCHLPLVGIRQRPPRLHVLAYLVDDRGLVVLLLLGGEPLALVEDERVLEGRLLVLPRLRNGRDELGAAAGLDDLLRRLPGLIQLPCRAGIAYGEFRIGRSKKGLATDS